MRMSPPGGATTTVPVPSTTSPVNSARSSVEHEHEMVRRVSRCVQHRQLSVRVLEPLAVSERAIVGEARPRVRVYRRAGRGGQRRGAGIVVGMTVRDQNRGVRRIGFAGGGEKGVALAVVDRTGIDRDERARSDAHGVAVRSVERQRRRVVRAQPADA